jgi:HPt (histidine-containing phosphotransfer) domain-containing protein
VHFWKSASRIFPGFPNSLRGGRLPSPELVEFEANPLFRRMESRPGGNSFLDGSAEKDYLWEYQLIDVAALSLLVAETILAPEIFDRLRQATASDPAVLNELCRDYLSEARSTMTQLRSAVSAGNARDVRERAHYLKGSSMMIGANGLSQCCATLEQMGRDGQLSGAEVALQRTMAALDAVEAALTQQLGPAIPPADESTK